MPQTNHVNSLSPVLLDRIVEIVASYSPDDEEAREIVCSHLQNADYVSCAIMGDQIIGVLMTSSVLRQTPFARHPLPVIYQRMLFLDSSVLGKGIGMRLFVKSMCDQLGICWLFKRFVLVCRTQSARVASKMESFSHVYPKCNQSIPVPVRIFAETLLPLLGAERLDDKFRLIGTCMGLEGEDYTAYWQSYLRSTSEIHNRLILNTTLYKDNEHVRNSGAFLLMIGYARPLALIELLLCYLRPVRVTLTQVLLRKVNS